MDQANAAPKSGVLTWSWTEWFLLYCDLGKRPLRILIFRRSLYHEYRELHANFQSKSLLAGPSKSIWPMLPPVLLSRFIQVRSGFCSTAT